MKDSDLTGEIQELHPKANEVCRQSLSLEMPIDTRFQILVENAPSGLAMIDRDGRFLYINPKLVLS